MKLLTRFIITFVIIATVVMGIGSVISYFVIRNEVDQEHDRMFRSRIRNVISAIEQGRSPDDFKANGLEIDDRPNADPWEGFKESDTLVTIERRGWEYTERQRKVSTIQHIDGKVYYIAAHGVWMEPNDISEVILKSLAWVLLVMLIVAALAIIYFSNYLIKPLKGIVDRIQKISIRSTGPVTFPDSDVYEYQQLSRFLEQMTEKARRDYRQLKEFTENASHEMQTPLSIAKGKLELLSETELDEEQTQLISTAQSTLSKLSSLNKSLSLLNKIENKEFDPDDHVEVSQLINQSLDQYRELIELHDLTLTTDITESVSIKGDRTLLDILWGNLLQNAIKHNIPGGQINITVQSDHLVIKNTGKPAQHEPHYYFQRFKKANQSSESFGLGLSIAKEICDLHGFTISYEQETPDSWHILRVRWS